MATAALVFPTLPSGKAIDSSKFSMTRADPAMRQEMEGGYTVTRARFTRLPPKKFSAGYTGITEADRVVLDNFWNTALGGSRAFSWKNPQDQVTYQVRFAGEIKFTYAGAGTTQRWNCDMELEQV